MINSIVSSSKRDYLAKLAFDGAKRIYGEPLSEEVKERMNF